MNADTRHNENIPHDDYAKGEKPIAYTVVPEEWRFYTNVAFLLGDVLDTMLTTACYHVNQLGLDFKHSTKQRWRNLLTQLRAAQRASKAFSREIYELEDTAQACEDSDYLADLILLISDRVGDSDELQQKLRWMIENMPSKCGFYDKINPR